MATHITTPTGLQNMNLDLTEDYILDNNLDMTGVADWVPIGDNSNHFIGTFDGQGFTISNLTYDDTIPDLGRAGLFGVVGIAETNRATIENLNLSNISLTSETTAGALAAHISSAYISLVTVDGITITGISSNPTIFGGLIGSCEGTVALHTEILNCDVSDFTYTSTAITSNVGGLMGFNSFETNPEEITITNCIVSDNNFSSSIYINSAGGLIGSGGGLISGCSASGVMDTVDGSKIGGLIGYSAGVQISKCYTEGTISNPEQQAGGFIGYISSTTDTIENCYSRVNITGNADGGSYFGGFIGEMRVNDLTITNCYSSGNITDADGLYSCGGFIGYLEDSTVTLTNCYSVGVLTVGAGTFNGGFIGEIYALSSPAPDITNCAWYTGSYDWAVGIDWDGNIEKSLTDEGWGTDEPVNTTFYFKTHVVYAQGT